MNTYRISTTVRSALISVKGKDVGEFHAYTPDTTKPHELILETIVNGASWSEALDAFRKDCMKMIDSLSLASGAPATWLTSSYLVEKENNDIVVLCILAESREGRVPITEAHVEDAQHLYNELSPSRDGLSNLRMAISTRVANLKLMLTLFAAENISGEEEVVSKCSCGVNLTCKNGHTIHTKRTNKKQLIGIIGKELHKQYFKGRREFGNKSIRTMLAHGKEVPLEKEDIEKIEELLLKLINHVRTEVNLGDIYSTHPFDNLVQGVMPWRATSKRANIYNLIRAQLKHDMASLGYEGVYELPTDY